MDRDLQLGDEDTPDLDSSCIKWGRPRLRHIPDLEQDILDEEIPTYSVHPFSRGTSAEMHEGRRYFERKAEMKRDMAKYGRESRKPKRPLSAYNLFFKAEREKILKEKRKPGFGNLAKEIAAKWKALDDKDGKQFDEEAGHEKRRYKVALSQWKAQEKLNSKKSIAYQGPHVMSLGEKVPTFTSPKLLLELYFQQRVAEEQQMKQLQFQHRLQLQKHFMEEQRTRQDQLQEFQNAALFAGPRRFVQERVMEEQQMRQAQLQNAAFAEIPHHMSKESDQCASLPMSFQGNIARHFSSCNMTAHHQGLSLSSVPPLSSIEPDPDGSFETYMYGDSGGHGAFMDPKLANAMMSMPFSSGIDSTQPETYDVMASCMVEPTPIRRSSLPCESNDSQRAGVLQHSPSSSSSICGVAEMNELQGVIHLLKNAGATGNKW
ncbi:high mobility group [Fragilaria crotonensis]|nr:high mobility group [Fragilaria crotonensis]